MAKYFNVNGPCRPDIHYMVNLEPKLREIKTMIDRGQYFTINTARQHGKTTTLRALSDYLKDHYIMLFLKPIINGVGNAYVEAETRNRERTDLIIDYHGEQFIIEMKIWRGNAYNERGEQQLTDYLDYYHLKKGYMLSFNFNKKKEIGVREIILKDKVLIEAVV